MRHPVVSLSAQGRHGRKEPEGFRRSATMVATIATPSFLDCARFDVPSLGSTTYRSGLSPGDDLMSPSRSNTLSA